MCRGYQNGLYKACPRLCDAESRERKAAKIGRIVTQNAQFPLSSATCLDVGCSSGLVTAALAPLFACTIGLEYDEGALQSTSPEARAQAAFIRGDAMSLPFPDASIDVVICAQVYEHVPDSARLATELYRVLAPGGLVFFSGPNRLFPIEPHYHLPFLHWLPEGLADAYLRLTKRGDHYYERSRTAWGLRHMLRGFVIEDVTADVLREEWPNSFLGRVIAAIPRVLEFCAPLYPNFNWILRKPREQ